MFLPLHPQVVSPLCGTQHSGTCETLRSHEPQPRWLDSGQGRSSLVSGRRIKSAVRERKPIDGTDIESNLVEIRRYLGTRLRLTGQDEGASDPREPSAWETYRYAEYSDGRRPMFAPTDLILVVLVLILLGLLAVFLTY